MDLSNERLKQVIDNFEYETKTNIGTLHEKALHRILKYYFDENESHHEIKIGNYYADICCDNSIIEIQTHQLGKLRDKLTYFLPSYRVLVVYPIVHSKRQRWFDPETGNLSSSRKSTKTGSFYDAFYELYQIKDLLNEDNLSICLMLIDVDEIRNLDGWSKNRKRGSTRNERFPTFIHDMLYFYDKIDYQFLIPNLPEVFTADDFIKAEPRSARYIYSILKVFTCVEVIECIGKDKRKNQFRIKKV